MISSPIHSLCFSHNEMHLAGSPNIIIVTNKECRCFGMNETLLLPYIHPTHHHHPRSVVFFTFEIASSGFCSSNVTICKFSSCTASHCMPGSLPCTSKEYILQNDSEAVRNLEFTNLTISSFLSLSASIETDAMSGPVLHISTLI